MTERFTDHLRRLGDSIWEAQFRHPFVQGIGAGTLPLAPFAHWVRQDYLYLIEYARLFAIGVARAPDLESMGRHADLAQATLKTEMELHRSYAAEFGITPEELEREVKSPTCQAYTDFLIRTAALGKLCGADGGPAPVHVGLLRDRPPPGRTGHAPRGALRQVGTHVHGP